MTTRRGAWAVIACAVAVGTAAVTGVPAQAATRTTVRTLAVTDVSPGSGAFAGKPTQGAFGATSESGRMTAVAASADGRRLYSASATTGLWRSSDGGATWCELTSVLACPDGAATTTPTRRINDVAVPPSPASGSTLLVAAASDSRASTRAGVYRSTDGGASWRATKQFTCARVRSAAVAVRFAPDPGNSTVAFAAGGCTVARSDDGGLHWSETNPTGGDSPVAYLAVSERDPATGGHWVYACTQSGLFYSSDDAHTWSSASADGSQPFTGCTFDGGPQRMATEPGQPGHVFLAADGMTNGPRFFDPGPDKAFGTADDVPDGSTCNALFTRADGSTGTPTCGEARLFQAQFRTSGGPGPSPAWRQLASPPAYFGDPVVGDSLVNSPSGKPFVVTVPKAGGGFLLFFSDTDTVHVHDGVPDAGPSLFGMWHRIDGWDPWASIPNGRSGTRGIFVHPDAQAMAVSPGFALGTVWPPSAACTPGNPSYATYVVYCGDTAGAGGQGTMWLANDGGVYRSTGGGAQGTWVRAAAGLATTTASGGTVLARPGGAAAVYEGVGDNSSFSLNPDYPEPDAGPAWRVPDRCGDCAPYFADARYTDAVVHVDQSRAPQFGLFRSPDGSYPQPFATTAGCQLPGVCLTVPYPTGGAMDPAADDRPVVQTLPSEQSPPLFDLVKLATTIDDGTGAPRARLWRTTNPFAPGGGWQQVGQVLPNAAAEAVQTTGGHATPTYYVRSADGALYRGRDTGAGVPGWDRMVPSVPPAGSKTAVAVCSARQSFVDPWTGVLYVEDAGATSLACTSTPGVRTSSDGGQTWQNAVDLERALTGGGTQTHACFGGACLLQDMVFVPGLPTLVFAMGTTGIVGTADGANWHALLSDDDLPCLPVSAGVAQATTSRPSLYAFCAGRGVLRLDLSVQAGPAA